MTKFQKVREVVDLLKGVKDFIAVPFESGYRSIRAFKNHKWRSLLSKTQRDKIYIKNNNNKKKKKKKNGHGLY
jgi:hypothetical protein